MPHNRHTNPPTKEALSEDIIPVQRHWPQDNRSQHINHKVHARDLEPPPHMPQRLLIERMHDLLNGRLRIGDVVDGRVMNVLFVDGCVFAFMEDAVAGRTFGRCALARARLIFNEVDAEEFAPIEPTRPDERNNNRVHRRREERYARAVETGELDLRCVDVDCATPVPRQAEPCRYA